MTEFGVFYQVYKNHKAVRFVLENFRKHFPDNPVILISDTTHIAQLNGGIDRNLCVKKQD